MVISHTLLAAWDAIISPTEIESIRQILHALHKTIIFNLDIDCNLRFHITYKLVYFLLYSRTQQKNF